MTNIRFRELMRLPRSLRWQLFLILFAGLAAAHVLSFVFLFTERYMTAEAMMLGNLEKDIGTSIAILDRLSPAERSQWLPMLARPNYHYDLGMGLPGVMDLDDRGSIIAKSIHDGIAPHFSVTVETIPGPAQHLQAHVILTDNSRITIDIWPQLMPLAAWLPFVLVAQLVLLILCTWLAVRLAIRPLLRFAEAAATLNPGRNAGRLEEAGPTEVAYAASAFNAMRDRIARHLDERVKILAAISHDLQTPITRMKLRTEIYEDSPQKERLLGDLSEIERLVREGVAYAKSAHGHTERESRIDLGSFLESIVFDYQDTGKPVRYSQALDIVALTRPHALRRILTNLIDNALKFAGDVEIDLSRTAAGSINIAVLDRGPGIPEHQLEAVLQPFYRLEQSRSRETGGTGLGLAISQQLAEAIGGVLQLSNRPEGGLAAEIKLN